MKRVKGTVLDRRQFLFQYRQLGANDAFRFRDRMDTPKLDDQATMLFPGEFDFRILSPGPANNRNRPPGLEDTIVFENDLDAYRAIEALRSGNAGDSNENRFVVFYRLVPGSTPGSTRRYSRISRVNRFLSFMPAALRIVLIDRAVLPCLPITLPRSL